MLSRYAVRSGSRPSPALFSRAWLVRATGAAALAALAACADDPTGASAGPTDGAPAAAAPAPVGPGAVRITFSGIGSPEQTATVVAGPPATAQAIAGAPSADRSAQGAALPPGDRGITPRADAIQLEYVASGSYTYGTRGSPGAYRYVYGFFRIRNATGAALSNVVLMSAFRPTNLASSGIIAVSLRGGVAPASVAAAEAIARSMIPAGSSMLSRGGLPVAGGVDALQIFTEADARSTTLSGGYTPLAYGYTVRDTVTNGRTLGTSSAGHFPGIALIAYKVPLQPTAAEDIYAFSVDFVPVTDGETRVTQSFEEQDAAGAAAASARADAGEVTELHVLPGSTLAGHAKARYFCGFRIAGSALVSPVVYAGTDCSSQFANTFDVAPKASYLQPGGSSQLSPIVSLVPPSTLPTTVTYQSSNPAVATVSATGLVTAVGTGGATIHVSTFAAPRATVAFVVVDNVPPVLTNVRLNAFIDADQARLGSTSTAQSYVFTITDDLAGFSATPISATLSRLRRNPDANGGTLVPECATGVSGFTPTYANATSQPGGVCPTVLLPAIVALAGSEGNRSAQYTLIARPVDVAGNIGSATTVRTLIDLVLPTVSATTVPATLTGGAAASFGLNATDNLELLSAYPTVQYGSALALQQPTVTIGTLFDATLTAGASGLAMPVTSFVRSVTLVSEGVPSGAAPGVASAVVATALDVGNNSASSTTAFGAGVVQNPPGAAVFTTGAPATNVAQFAFSTINPATSTATAANPVVATTTSGGALTSLTLRADEVGATGSYVTPFQRVELYVRNGTVNGAPVYRLLDAFPVGTVTDDGGVRRVRRELTLTPSTYPLLAGSAGGTVYELRVVGITANGDALVSDAVSVTVRTP